MKIQQLITKANAKLKFELARAWDLINQPDLAIAGYQESIATFPRYMPAYLHLGKLLVKQGKLEEAFNIYTQAIEINPDKSEIHKYFLRTILKKEGLDYAFNFYNLSRQDNKSIVIKENDVLLFTCIRNESIRLPFFLSYYRSKGIKHFFFIDNNSTDNTVSYLENQENVYVWQTPYSYRKANVGMAWVELLLRKYGINHWCLIVDADEIFYYPNCENKKISDLCQVLDNNGKKYLSSILLDMYSDQPISETYYKSGENLLEICPYFDKKFYHTKKKADPMYENQLIYIGGVRQRVFGKEGGYYLNKVPLIKYNPDISLTSGQHFIDGAFNDVAQAKACLLHFKYLSFFGDHVKTQVMRNEYQCNSLDYKQYAKTMDENPAVTLYDQAHSLKLSSSKQLVELGIMKMGEMANNSCSG